MVIRKWANSNKLDHVPAFYLVLVLACFCLQMLEFLFGSSGFYRQYPFLINTFDPITIMWPFFMSNYILAINGVALPKLYKHHIAHFIIPVGFLVCELPFMLENPDYKVKMLYEKILRTETIFTPQENWPFLMPSRSEQILIMGMTALIYWFRTRTVLSKLPIKTSELQRYTSYCQQASLGIALVMIGFSVFGYTRYTNIIMSALLLLFIWSLSYYFLTRMKHPSQPRHPKPANEASASEPANVEIDEELLVIFQSLEKEIISGSFKDPSFSLTKLSNAVGFRVQLCSKAINDLSGSNFYDWVNRYRIEEAKKQLANPSANIDLVYHTVGFNSKSTFYTAFKKFHGTTPGQFRKSL